MHDRDHLAKNLPGPYGYYMRTTVEAIYEAGKLILPQPLPLPGKAHVIVTIETQEQDSDAERAAWLKHSEGSLVKARDNSEDEIFDDLTALNV